MNRVWTTCGWTLMVVTLVGIGARGASAQTMHPWTDRGFVNVNGGFQTQARTATAEGSQPLYDEDATFEASIGVGNAPLIDVAGGWRLWRNLAVGIGVSRYSDTSGTTLVASIPDPLFFDTPHQASVPVSGLRHTEVATHVSAIWVMPFTDTIDVAISFGPSVYAVSKDVVTGISVAPGTTSLTDVSTGTVSETGVGGHVALDVHYILLEDLGPFRTVGAGLFLRYGTASIDVDGIDGSLDVGGLNYGLGVRLRF